MISSRLYCKGYWFAGFLVEPCFTAANTLMPKELNVSPVRGLRLAAVIIAMALVLALVLGVPISWWGSGPLTALTCSFDWLIC